MFSAVFPIILQPAHMFIMLITSTLEKSRHNQNIDVYYFIMIANLYLKNSTQNHCDENPFLWRIRLLKGIKFCPKQDKLVTKKRVHQIREGKKSLVM